MQLTEAEKNLIFFLRTRHPYEVVKIRHGKDGKADFYFVNTEQKMIINNLGIEECPIKDRELSTFPQLT